jgi:hypothetical protein
MLYCLVHSGVHLDEGCYSTHLSRRDANTMKFLIPTLLSLLLLGVGSTAESSQSTDAAAAEPPRPDHRWLAAERRRHRRRPHEAAAPVTKDVTSTAEITPERKQWLQERLQERAQYEENRVVPESRQLRSRQLQDVRIVDELFPTDLCLNVVGASGREQDNEYGPCDPARFPVCAADEMICFNRSPLRSTFYEDIRQPI